MNRPAIARFALVLLLSPSFACAQRDAPALDVYGYRFADSLTAPAECAYAPVPLDGGATTLVPTSGDDGAADLGLDATFEFYGEPVAAMRVSSNGYLAIASASTPEDGADFSADCPLPAIPDNAAAALARVYVLHADLELDASSTLRSQFFPACPRPAASGDIEACTAIEWRDVLRDGVAGPRATFQALLYHGSFEIALQHLVLPAGFVPAATVGLQNRDVSSGAAWRCGSTLPPETQAVCLLAAPQSNPSFQITTQAQPAAGGTTSGDGNYVFSTPVTVVATPNTGYHFLDWSEGSVVQSLNPSYSFTVTGNRTLVANFALNSYAISAMPSPPAGGSTSGAGTYLHGETVNLLAIPTSGYAFVNWTEDATALSTQPALSFTAESARSLTANFVALPNRIFANGFE